MLNLYRFDKLRAITLALSLKNEHSFMGGKAKNDYICGQ